MARFSYKAIDLEGNQQRGIAEAEDYNNLSEILKVKNLYILKSKKLTEKRASSIKLKDTEIAAFSKEIASMTGAGISINNAIEVIIQGNSQSKNIELYKNIYRCISMGMTLSEALEVQGDTFPQFFINMYKSGEESGTLSEVAQKMSALYENQYKVESKVKAAMLYPKILFSVMILVVIVIFTVVMPKLFDLFSTMDLPLPTRIMIGISNAFMNHWYIIVMVVASVILAFKIILSNKKVSLYIDKFKIKGPLIGKLNSTIITARFARTLSSLYSAGLSIDKSMAICSKIIQNKYLEAQFAKAITKIRTGVSISDAIKGIDGFESKLIMTIYIGQESGRLDEMLESISNSYDEQSQVAVQKLVGLLEPILIVFMAGMVAFIALSIMLPMMQMYNNIG